MRVYLIPLDLQLAPLVQLGVLQTDSAELKIACKDSAVVGGERGLVVARLVDDLSHANHFTIRVFDRQTKHGPRVISSHGIHVMVKAFILQRKSKEKKTYAYVRSLFTVSHSIFFKRKSLKGAKKWCYFVCVGYVDRLATLGDISDDSRSPRYADLFLLLHLF